MWLIDFGDSFAPRLPDRELLMYLSLEEAPHNVDVCNVKLEIGHNFLSLCYFLFALCRTKTVLVTRKGGGDTYMK